MTTKRTPTKRTPPKGGVQSISHHPGDPLLFMPDDPMQYFEKPTRHYDGDAGFDLFCSRTVTVPPGGFAQIPTNIKVALPIGIWAMITGRSSTFFNRQLLVQQAIIDNGWRGPLWSVVYNMSQKAVVVRRGDRISQLILFRLVTPEVMQVEELPESNRGEKGFGSTGGGGSE
jgi:dUTP pyrophosphatase